MSDFFTNESSSLGREARLPQGICRQPAPASCPRSSSARDGGPWQENRPSLCHEGAVAAGRQGVSGVRLRSRPPPGGGPAAGAAARPSRSAARRRRLCPAAALSEGTRQALDQTTRPLCPRTVAAARYPSMRPGRRVPPRAMPATPGALFETGYRRADSPASSTTRRFEAKLR